MLTCRLSSVLGHLTLLASSLLLCTLSLWAQKSSPPGGIQIQTRSFDHSRQLAPIPGARAYLGAMPGKLPDAPRSQTESRATTPLRIRYHYTFVDTRAATHFLQPIGTAELPSETKHFARSTLNHRLTPVNGMVRYSTIRPAEHSQSYGHYIPWAGPVISRVAQQAKAHPHVTSMLKLFQPQF